MNKLTDNISYYVFEQDSNYYLMCKTLLNIHNEPCNFFWLLTKKEFNECDKNDLQYTANNETSLEGVKFFFNLYGKYKSENQSFDSFLDECYDGLPERIKEVIPVGCELSFSF